MTGQKPYREQNRDRKDRYKRESSLLKRAAGIRGIVLVLFLALTEPFPLAVKAEPATLRSPDATVYEQTNEGSNPIGNLVEGGSFDYIGDVTAEDGSVWHQITTANGATGYIRADKEIETGAGEPAPEGEQEAPAGEGSVGNDAGGAPQANPTEGQELEGNSTEEGAGEGENPEEAGGDDREAPEENGTEAGEAGQDGDGELSEGGEGEALDEGEAVPAFHMQNNQAKKYAAQSSQKVKERESFAQWEIDAEDITGKRVRIDFPLVAGIIVVFFCGGIISICWKGMRRMKRGSGESANSVSDTNKGKAHKRAERKRHSQKRKSTKIIQGKKRN